MDHKHTIGALQGFIHDLEEGESELSEITNILGPNELNYLLKMAKLGEQLQKSIDTVVEESNEKGELDWYLPCTGKVKSFVGFDTKDPTKDMEKTDCSGSIPMWFDPKDHKAYGACFMCGEKKVITLIPSSHFINHRESKTRLIPKGDVLK